MSRVEKTLGIGMDSVKRRLCSDRAISVMFKKFDTSTATLTVDRTIF
ncbi:hypothetical protein JOC94_002397 [Bacillus thermophilus]|uniref:Transposase n=1 Tax=Siminovitchia thermophila TaxID=1245522 RepID=A0ABS2R7M0_9BACI|nr:hypothetical protein [Siminovitchia thermophila]MBM7715410.1 hypothetical protein [Siminovitchia thermophila]